MSLVHREQSKVGFQELERKPEVLNSSKTGTEMKSRRSNFEKQEPLLKPRTKPITSGQKSQGQQGTLSERFD